MSKSKLENDFTGLPGVSIIGCHTKRIITFTSDALDLLGATIGDTISFKAAENRLYIALCPITENLNGCIVSVFCNRFHCSIPVKHCHILPNGRYTLSDPFYSKGIDWFELIPFKIN